MDNVHARADEIARASYGKLVAIIAAKTGDIAAAEDFISYAFQRALETWVRDGVPPNPEAWLVTTAKNKFLDDRKSAATRNRAPEEDAMDILTVSDELETDQITDKRLALMFACAHPAIEAKIHTPLILQTILGLEANHIATIFAVPSSAMAQRLVRAKRKIKLTRIPFELPTKEQIPERLEAVLQAIYGAYAIGVNLGDDTQQDLADEAIYLSDLVVRALPENAEVTGLAALLSYAIGCAHHSPNYVPLTERATSDWNHPLLDRADRLLARARGMNDLGRFQLEAAIFSVHADRRKTGRIDYNALGQLYSGLVALYPTLGAQVAQAAVVGISHGPETALKLLKQLPAADVSGFQPYWATLATQYQALGNANKTREAARKAISLTTHAGHRAWLEKSFADLYD